MVAIVVEFSLLDLSLLDLRAIKPLRHYMSNCCTQTQENIFQEVHLHEAVIIQILHWTHFALFISFDILYDLVVLYYVCITLHHCET